MNKTQMIPVTELYIRCSYPLRPDAIAASDTCQHPANTAVQDAEGNLWYRCPSHEGELRNGVYGKKVVTRVRRKLPVNENPPASGQPRYIAHFTPEAWVRDQAVEVDAAGPQEWDCTAYARQHLDYLAGTGRRRGERPDDPAGVLDNDDVFAGDPAAPEWVRTWQGPFTIRVREEAQAEGITYRVIYRFGSTEVPSMSTHDTRAEAEAEEQGADDEGLDETWIEEVTS